MLLYFLLNRKDQALLEALLHGEALKQETSNPQQKFAKLFNKQKKSNKTGNCNIFLSTF
jgi:hypothetical protein